MYHLATMNSITDRQMTLWCQQPILLHAVQSGKTSFRDGDASCYLINTKWVNEQL